MDVPLVLLAGACILLTIRCIRLNNLANVLQEKLDLERRQRQFDQQAHDFKEALAHNKTAPTDESACAFCGLPGAACCEMCH